MMANEMTSITNTNALNLITHKGAPLTLSLSPVGRGEGEGEPLVKKLNAFVLIGP
jgi:hypothetical protein